MCLFSFGVAYYVAFGPHGPRAPTSQPGDNLKIFLATAGLVGVATVLGSIIHLWGGFSCFANITRPPDHSFPFLALFRLIQLHPHQRQ